MIRLRPSPRLPRRKGAVLPLMAMLSVVIIGMLAFAVDLGYISLVRGQMQSAADAASLAAASQLLDRDLLHGDAYQDTAGADAQALRFSSANEGGGVSLATGTGDVVYGYIANPKDPGSPFVTNRRPFNSAQVRVQRTNQRNGELGLFFAPIFHRDALGLDATATATLEGNIKGFEFNPNVANQKCMLLPFTLDIAVWKAALAGTVLPNGEMPKDEWKRDPVTGAVTKQPDGVREMKLFPTKGTAPGNFGTVDIGSPNNSTSDIVRQILNGPNQNDFTYFGGRIELNSTNTLVLEGDTGISAGFKEELLSIRGQPRIIPLYVTPVTGNGNNSRFTIVCWVGCTILDVQLTGGNKYVTIQPEFCIDSTAVGGGPVSDSSFAYKPLQLSR